MSWFQVSLIGLEIEKLIMIVCLSQSSTSR